MIETIGQPGVLTAIAFFGIWVGLWLPLAIPVAIALQWRPPQPITPEQKIPLVLTLYALAPVALGLVSSLADQSWASYGWVLNSQMLRSCGLGLLVGAASLLMTYWMQIRLGWLQQVSQAEDADPPTTLSSIGQTLGLTLLVALIVGAAEELIFRGFLMQCLDVSIGVVGAAIASSAIFAGLHLVWEGRKGLWQLPGLWLMGIALVLARYADQGQLGLPWGLHAGWVWVVASFDALPLIQPSGHVPNWITGIQGHPLAGGLGVGFMILMAIALYSLTLLGLGAGFLG